MENQKNIKIYNDKGYFVIKIFYQTLVKNISFEFKNYKNLIVRHIMTEMEKLDDMKDFIIKAKL